MKKKMDVVNKNKFWFLLIFVAMLLTNLTCANVVNVENGSIEIDYEIITFNGTIEEPITTTSPDSSKQESFILKDEMTTSE